MVLEARTPLRSSAVRVYAATLAFRYLPTVLAVPDEAFGSGVRRRPEPRAGATPKMETVESDALDDDGGGGAVSRRCPRWIAAPSLALGRASISTRALGSAWSWSVWQTSHGSGIWRLR